MSGVVRLGVNLSPDVALLFHELCKRHGASMTDGIRLAIIAWREATPNELAPIVVDAAQDRLNSIADLHAEWTQGSMDVVMFAHEVGRVLWYGQPHKPKHLASIPSNLPQYPRPYPWRPDGPSMARHTPLHLLSPKD